MLGTAARSGNSRQTAGTYDRDFPEKFSQKELKSWLLALPKPVGIFAANDFTAKETHDILIHGGVAIPDNAALLGIDNISDICDSVTPGISSIASDFEQGGWLCADLLLERIANPSLRRKTLLYPSLGVVPMDGEYMPPTARGV